MLPTIHIDFLFWLANRQLQFLGNIIKIVYGPLDQSPEILGWIIEYDVYLRWKEKDEDLPFCFSPVRYPGYDCNDLDLDCINCVIFKMSINNLLFK